jgi:hypothetical protein
MMIDRDELAEYVATNAPDNAVEDWASQTSNAYSLLLRASDVLNAVSTMNPTTGNPELEHERSLLWAIRLNANGDPASVTLDMAREFAERALVVIHAKADLVP